MVTVKDESERKEKIREWAKITWEGWKKDRGYSDGHEGTATDMRGGDNTDMCLKKGQEEAEEYQRDGNKFFCKSLAGDVFFNVAGKPDSEDKTDDDGKNRLSATD